MEVELNIISENQEKIFDISFRLKEDGYMISVRDGKLNMFSYHSKAPEAVALTATENFPGLIETKTFEPEQFLQWLRTLLLTGKISSVYLNYYREKKEEEDP